MPSLLLAPGTAEAVSAATVLADGEIATIFLTSDNGSGIPHDSPLFVQLQRSTSAWNDLHVLRAPHALTAEVRGPVTFRVARRSPGVYAAPLGAEVTITTSSGGGGGGSVTVTNFPATQPVSAAALPLPAGAATSAAQTTGNNSLSSIDGKLPASLGAKTSAASLSMVPATDANVARESYTTVTPLTLSTLNPGSGFAQFGSQACTSLDLVNNTGTTLEYRRGAGGTVFIPIPPGASRLIQGITNANTIYVRRVDQSNTVVTMVAEAFQV